MEAYVYKGAVFSRGLLVFGFYLFYLLDAENYHNSVAEQARDCSTQWYLSAKTFADKARAEEKPHFLLIPFKNNKEFLSVIHPSKIFSPVSEMWPAGRRLQVAWGWLNNVKKQKEVRDE